MRLFLELFGVMIVMQLTAGTNNVAEMQLNFWRENLPSVQVPDSVAASMSPLTQKEMNMFTKMIKDGNLRSHATQFCISANLLCNQSVDVVPFSDSVFIHHGSDGELNLDEMNDIFFSANELREGGQITLPDLYSPWKAFLPRNLSQLIPFATVALSDVLPSFGISERSKMALNMNMTLSSCEAKPQQGEIYTCTASIEGMIEFVLSNLASDDNLELASHPAPTVDSGKKARVKNVVKRLSGPSNRPPLACHRFVYPYGVFYCHSINGTSIFSMELEVLDNKGNNYNATALCHPNARSNGSTMELEVLDNHGNNYNATALCHPNVRSNGSNLCHLILGDTLLWLIKDKHY